MTIRNPGQLAVVGLSLVLSAAAPAAAAAEAEGTAVLLAAKGAKRGARRSAAKAESEPPPPPQVPSIKPSAALLAGELVELRLPERDGEVVMPRVSPDGSRVVVEIITRNPARNHSLWMLAWDGSGSTSTPEEVLPESRYSRGRSERDFAWNPRAGSQYPFALVVEDRDSSGIRVEGWSEHAMHGDAPIDRPVWTPGEDRFLASWAATGKGDLYLWDEGRSMQLTFAENATERSPSIDPRGSRVAFEARRPTVSHVLILELDRWTALPLVQFQTADAVAPSFGPGGGLVAFLKRDHSSPRAPWGLFVTESRPGGTPIALHDAVLRPHRGGPPWLPDGSALVAALHDDERGGVLGLIPVDGSPPIVLDLPVRDIHDPELFWLDGHELVAFVARRAEDQPWAVYIAAVRR